MPKISNFWPTAGNSQPLDRLPEIAKGLRALKHCCAVTDSAGRQPAAAEIW